MSGVRWVGSSVLLKGSQNTCNSQSYPNKEEAPTRSPAYCLHNAKRLSPTSHLRRDKGGEWVFYQIAPWIGSRKLLNAFTVYLSINYLLQSYVQLKWSQCSLLPKSQERGLESQFLAHMQPAHRWGQHWRVNCKNIKYICIYMQLFRDHIYKI